VNFLVSSAGGGAVLGVVYLLLGVDGFEAGAEASFAAYFSKKSNLYNRI